MYYFHRSLMSFIPSNVAIIIFKGISNIPSPIIFCKVSLLYKRFLSNSSRSLHFSFHHFSLALYFFPHSSLLCFLFSVFFTFLSCSTLPLPPFVYFPSHLFWNLRFLWYYFFLASNFSLYICQFCLFEFYFPFLFRLDLFTFFILETLDSFSIFYRSFWSYPSVYDC